MKPTQRKTAPHRTGVPNLSSWTITTIRNTLDAHERGIFSGSALLADWIERNPRIMGALATRTQGALGLPFCLEPSTERRSSRIAVRELEPPWARIAPEPLLSDLLRWAVLLGVAFAEMWWESLDGNWVPRLRVVHPYYVQWRDYEGRYYCQTTDRGLVPITPGDGWVVFSSSSDRPWMRGVVRCLGLESEIRSLAVRDWARWSEVHGLPIKKAKVPAQASETDKENFFDGVEGIGSEGVALLPQGDTPQQSFDIELLEAVGREYEGFQKLIDLVSVDTAIAILGQNLTSEVSGGSYAAAQVHDRVRQDYLEADTETLSTCLREQVLEPWALYNRGDASLAPWPCWDASIPEDRAQLATTLATTGAALAAWDQALAPQGVAVDVEALAARMNLPLRKLPAPVPTQPAPTTAPTAQD